MKGEVLCMLKALNPNNDNSVPAGVVLIQKM